MPKLIISRRAALGLAGLATLVPRALAAVKLVKIAVFDAYGRRTGVKEVEKIKKTDAEWKTQLTPEQYQVTRRAGTERAFTGKYANNHEDGIYNCVCCGTPLFDSKTKF